MPKLLIRSVFAERVAKLEPAWRGMSSTLERYLQIFDESGDLRPEYRVVFPEEFAYWSAGAKGYASVRAVSELEEERFSAAWDAIRAPEFAHDPDASVALDNLPAEWLGEVHRPTQDEEVRWSEWTSKVGEVDGRPIEGQRCIAVYAEWQRLRVWTLLEQYTFRALLDPRKVHPSQVFDRAWDRDLRGSTLVWTTGNPRPNRLVEEMEAGGWLAKLYHKRDVYHHAQRRVWAPAAYGWPEGEQWDADERARRETARARERARALGEPWLDAQDDFVGRIRHMVELWTLVPGPEAVKIRGVIEDDLRSAVRWAQDLYGCELEVLDRAVGGCGLMEDVTIMHVLRPDWRSARTVAERDLPPFVHAFNTTLTDIRLEAGDVQAFLDFLDARQLWAWYAEFAAVMEELDEPGDLTWDRRFLHLRSLVILHEPVLVALGDEHGTPDDRRHLASGNLKGPLRAFLQGRAGWRERVWQTVSNHWELTQTIQQPIATQLAAIEALPGGPRMEIARTLLSFGAIRNFGSHRFSRDPEFWNDHQAQLLRAAVFTPLLYWKVAVTLG